MKKFFRGFAKLLLFIVLFGSFYAILNLSWLGSWTTEPQYWKPHLTYGDTTQEIYISVTTPVPCRLQVEWERNENGAWNAAPVIADDVATTFHNLLLQNLQPGQDLRYSLHPTSEFVNSLDEKIIADLAQTYVIPGRVIINTTPRSGSTFSFGIYGDNRPTIFGTADHDAIAQAILMKQPNFVLQVGDLVQTGGLDAEWARFFTTGEPLFRTTPLLPTIGNHEYYGGTTINQNSTENATKYLDAFHLPGAENYYAYNISNAHFICLDISGSDGAKNEEVQTAQMLWLDDHLSHLNRSAFDWLFVFFHYPIESSGQNHENIWDEILGPVFTAYNLTIDILFVGHIHQYERIYIDRMHTWNIITAGGGAEIEQWKAGELMPGSTNIELSHSFSFVEVDGLQVNFHAYFMKGKEFDALTLTKPVGGL